LFHISEEITKFLSLLSVSISPSTKVASFLTIDERGIPSHLLFIIVSSSIILIELLSFDDNTIFVTSRESLFFMVLISNHEVIIARVSTTCFVFNQANVNDCLSIFRFIFF